MFQRMRDRYVLTLLALLLGLNLNGSAFGQGNRRNTNQHERQVEAARESLQKREEEAKQSKKDLDDARKSEREAIEERAKVMRQIQQLRAELEEELKKTPIWEQQHQALEQARVRWEELSKPILEQVRATADYQRLLKQVEELDTQISRLKSQDDLNKRKELVDEQARLRSRQLDLENESIGKSAEASKARKDHEQEKEHFAKLNQRMHHDMENEPALRKLLNEFESAKTAVAKATTQAKEHAEKYGRAQAAVKTAEAKLAQERQQLEQARRNNNNNNGRKNNNNNNGRQNGNRN